MTNRAKRKGTRYENEVLEDLRKVFGPDVERAPAGSPSRDFTGTGKVRVEAKQRARWDVRAWAKRLWDLQPNGYWVLCVADADRRRATSVPDVVILPRTFGFELLETWRRSQHDQDSAPAIS